MWNRYVCWESIIQLFSIRFLAYLAYSFAPHSFFHLFFLSWIVILLDAFKRKAWESKKKVLASFPLFWFPFFSFDLLLVEFQHSFANHESLACLPHQARLFNPITQLQHVLFFLLEDRDWGWYPHPVAGRSEPLLLGHSLTSSTCL